MRKSIMFGAVALVLLMAGLAGWSYLQYQATKSDFLALQASELESRERYRFAVEEIGAIQDSLEALSIGEEEARLATEADAELRLTETEGDRTLARIAVIKASIDRTKARIASLESKIKERGAKIGGLETMIANLRSNVAEKERRVDVLSDQVESLRAEVTDLVAHVDKQDHTIEAKRRELGTIYYLVGDKRKLMDSGVVVASGGLLGIGKTLEPSGEADLALFQVMDTDLETVIRIPSADVEVLTAQPVASYRLEVIGEETELRIMDPEAFRTVKQLIVKTG